MQDPQMSILNLDPKDIVKAGLGVASELLAGEELPGGIVTHEIIDGVFQWAREAIDAHSSPEAARDAIRAALSTYGADAARKKFGDG